MQVFGPHKTRKKFQLSIYFSLGLYSFPQFQSVAKFNFLTQKGSIDFFGLIGIVLKGSVFAN